MGIKAALDEAIARGGEIQIKFKHDFNPSPVAGTVERFNTYDAADAAHETPNHVYRMMMPADIQMGATAKRVVLPIVFDIENVLWFSEGPLDENGEKIVLTPKAGAPSRSMPGRTPAGLHIPR